MSYATAATGTPLVTNASGTALSGAKIIYGTVVGPASYSTGGFVVDLSARFTSLKWVAVTTAIIGATLPVAVPEVTLDVPTGGKFTVRLLTHTLVNLLLIELTAATNLASTTFSYLALGA